MTDRNATIAATPTAMQTKKKSRRLHDGRVSRTAMRSTNIIIESPPPRSVPQDHPRVGQAGELRVVRDEHQRGAARP